MITVNFETEVDEKQAKETIREIVADSMGGWANLPVSVDMSEIARIKQAAEEIRESSEVLVCIGIGGSYLGHRAIIEALRPKGVEIIYVGNSLSQRELLHSLNVLGDRDFSVNVISKSGTTLEPALALNVFKQKLIEKYGEVEAVKRIFVTTDAEKGLLHDEATQKGYIRFVIPNNIGGRYSVLTAVGLLPMAVAGIDIDQLLAGAKEMAESLNKNPVNINPMVQYAFMRYALRERNYDTEVFASFEPATMYFNEWLKQLFGESEGKGRQGVFPASVIYSTDLHSMGQFMQDGRRNLWETIIDFPTDEMNAKIVEAVKRAHTAGGIPVLNVKVPSFDENSFGQLVYFFEMSCAISVKLAGANPFNKPGVEAYKLELKRLLEAK